MSERPIQPLVKLRWSYNVQLFVGKDKTEFTVPKDLICSKSEVFEKMFNGSFMEGISGRADLPEDDPVQFDWFLEWLYLGASASVPSRRREMLDTVKLYCFASKYRIMAFMDFLVDEVISQMPTSDVLKYYSQEIKYLYSNCLGKCGLKRYMVKLLLYCFSMSGEPYLDAEAGRLVTTGEGFARLMGESYELACDFFTLLKDVHYTKWKTLNKVNTPCEYHEHGAKSPCQSQNFLIWTPIIK